MTNTNTQAGTTAGLERGPDSALERARISYRGLAAEVEALGDRLEDTDASAEQLRCLLACFAVLMPTVRRANSILDKPE